MKKIIPIIAILGSASLLTGCNALANIDNKLENNLETFQECLNNYNQISGKNLSKAVNNYMLTVTIPEGATLVDAETETLENNLENSEKNNTDTQDETLNNTKQENQNENISTLFSISSDIEEYCDDFYKLKENILSAIAETENLIEKLEKNEITITREQRLFVNEQSNQLKNLSRQLSNATTELSFNLSDLNAIMKENNQDLDNLSLKYLVVLDSLINGNEMLQNGLSSLNLINNVFNMNKSNLPPNNGRILYSFQQNGQDRVVKDYYIDENGEIVENNTNSTGDENSENDINNESNTNNTTLANIDTYNDRKLKSNIDTYGNKRQNIDTFFNTALLDNEFMYGNNGYAGSMGMYGYGNPYINKYHQYEQLNKENSTNGVIEQNNTQNVDKSSKETKKKFKLKSNIDTYKDENTPDVKTKLNNFKQSVSQFFNRFNIRPKENIKNPIYKFTNNDEN